MNFECGEQALIVFSGSNLREAQEGCPLFGFLIVNGSDAKLLCDKLNEAMA